MTPTDVSARIHLGDCLMHLRDLETDSLDSMVTDPPAGIAFMGKAWDRDKGGRDGWVAWLTEVMVEALRVLKPGAHALVWAIPRTQHWTATAIEDAGFEIRDVVTHLFGTGFPKSLDVSKAIDKAAGAERQVIGDGQAFGKGSFRNKSRVAQGYRQTEVNPDGGNAKITAPATAGAAAWQGWGTALKPAAEFWILCRKPLAEGTVAANVLKHGTGAVNVDGCRIGTADTLSGSGQPPLQYGGQNSRPFHENAKARPFSQNNSGRFPSNLVLSHSPDCDDACAPGCAVAELDEQSGTLKSGAVKTRSGSRKQNFGMGSIEVNSPSSEGGASRFFYCSKSSKADRGPDNNHPTVKSRKLMSYLCRLVTPPGGSILDPFAGSGSTGVAAVSEGFHFVGIEQEAEYAETARRRLIAAGVADAEVWP